MKKIVGLLLCIAFVVACAEETTSEPMLLAPDGVYDVHGVFDLDSCYYGLLVGTEVDTVWEFWVEDGVKKFKFQDQDTIYDGADVTYNDRPAVRYVHTQTAEDDQCDNYVAEDSFWVFKSEDNSEFEGYNYFFYSDCWNACEWGVTFTGVRQEVD